MKLGFHKVWPRALAVLIALLAWCVPARAALVDLDAYVLYTINDRDNAFPLAQGSIVYLIGSTDSANDGMMTSGTNYMANTVQNDDVILATITIGQNTDADGLFWINLQYDSDVINFVYIRFFEYTNTPITGMVYWGTSAVYELGVTLGVSTVQFDPDGNLYPTNYNNFVVIPEPSTANLIVLVGGLMLAMGASARRKSVKQEGQT